MDFDAIMSKPDEDPGDLADREYAADKEREAEEAPHD